MHEVVELWWAHCVEWMYISSVAWLVAFDPRTVQAVASCYTD
jgi:hypothetical protein